MSEKPAPTYHFSDNGSGLKVSVGDTESLFLRAYDKALTLSVTKWRPIFQSTDFKDRIDGAPTLLSHFLRIEAHGKLKYTEIGFINGGHKAGKIKEFPVFIRQYDDDNANRIIDLRDAARLLRHDNDSYKYYDKSHTAALYFDPKDTSYDGYFPSTFLEIYVSKDLMEELLQFIHKYHPVEIEFQLKFFNIFTQLKIHDDDEISHSHFAFCKKEENVIYGNLNSFSVKTVDHDRSDNNGDGGIYREQLHQRETVSNDLRFHQSSIQQTLQKISENISYILYVTSFIIFVIIFS